MGPWRLFGLDRSDAEHGPTRAVAVEHAIDEVQAARPAAPRARREIARQMRLGTGRERGDLLVPDVNPRDLPLPADGVGQPVQAVADDSVDPLDTRSGEGFRELVSQGPSHDTSPRAKPAVAATWAMPLPMVP